MLDYSSLLFSWLAVLHCWHFKYWYCRGHTSDLLSPHPTGLPSKFSLSAIVLPVTMDWELHLRSCFWVHVSIWYRKFPRGCLTIYNMPCSMSGIWQTLIRKKQKTLNKCYQWSKWPHNTHHLFCFYSCIPGHNECAPQFSHYFKQTPGTILYSTVPLIYNILALTDVYHSP